MNKNHLNILLSTKAISEKAKENINIENITAGMKMPHQGLNKINIGLDVPSKPKSKPNPQKVLPMNHQAAKKKLEKLMKKEYDHQKVNFLVK